MRAVVVVGLLVAMGFTGCTFCISRTSVNSIKDRFDAEKTMKTFYEYQDLESMKILKLFSSDFLDKTGKDSLQLLFRYKRTVYGTLKKDSLQKWETIVRKGLNPNSKYFFAYNNTYENGRITESFTLKKGFFGTIKIVDYRIK